MQISIKNAGHPSRPRAVRSSQNALQARYDRMWAKTIEKIWQGRVDLDTVLKQCLPDSRRGLTVIARPPPGVCRKVTGFLRDIQVIDPSQYYYPPSGLHMTVLSLFTATVDHKAFLSKAREYIAAVDTVLDAAAPIPITFKGITASQSSVAIQGFLESSSLNELRDELRGELRARGLTKGLDVRYRLETAHVTVIRFRAPLRERTTFAAALEQARQRFFGVALVKNLSLVENDWYMSASLTRTVKRYRLAGAG
jgi:2'-5' RNA ligase